MENVDCRFFPDTYAFHYFILQASMIVCLDILCNGMPCIASQNFELILLWHCRICTTNISKELKVTFTATQLLHAWFRPDVLRQDIFFSLKRKGSNTGIQTVLKNSLFLNRVTRTTEEVFTLFLCSQPFCCVHNLL